MTPINHTSFEASNEISRQKFVIIMVMVVLLLAAALTGIYLLSAQKQLPPTIASANLLSQQELSHLSLQAVAIGAASAFVIQMTFNLIALSLGILKPSSIRSTERISAVGFDHATIGWLILVMIIAGLIGGHVTTSLANMPYLLDSLLHAGLVWVVSLLITAISIFICTEMPQAIAFVTASDQHYSN